MAFLTHGPLSDNCSLTYLVYAMMKRAEQGDHLVRSDLFGM
jgi:hypothetical protein